VLSVLYCISPHSELRFKRPSRSWVIFGFALLAYAVLLFVYDYGATGGATSAAFTNGRYVYMYKSQIMRTITEHEYTMFPNRVTRLMSAWTGMMAAFTAQAAPVHLTDLGKH